MHHPKHRVRRGVSYLCAVLALAACDSDSSGPTPETPFEPTQAMDALGSIGDAMDASDLGSALNLVMFTLAQAETAPDPELLELPIAGAPLAARSVALASAAGSFPVSLMGRTLVYDQDELGYVVDPQREGAPASGVRFIVYEMDVAAGRPALPLEEVGYLDLTVVGEDDTSLVLGVMFVSTAGAAPETRAQYVVSVIASETGAGTELGLESNGFVVGEDGRVDFEVERYFVFPAGAGLGSYTQRTALELAGESLSYERSLALEFDAATFSPVGDAQLLNTIANGADTLTLDVAIAEDDELSGIVELNDEPILRVAGSFASPLFRLADGTLAPAETRAAMADLWLAAGMLETGALGLLGPGDVVAAF